MRECELKVKAMFLSLPVCRERREKLADIKANIRDIIVVSFFFSTNSISISSHELFNRQ